MTVPTGSTYEWTYQIWDLNAGLGKDWVETVTAIDMRTLTVPYDKGSGFGTSSGSWQYDNFNNVVTDTRVVHVTDPLNHLTKHYFYSNETEDARRGLPLTTSGALASPHDSGLFLSRQEFSATDHANPLRSFYVRYAYGPGRSTPTGPYFPTNPHVLKEEVIYHDDDDGNNWGSPGGNSAWTKTERSSYDGLGHFRTSTTTSSLGSGSSASPTSRVSTSNFNKVSTTYSCDWDSGCSGTAPSLSGEWVLGIFNYTQVSEGGDTDKTEFCFDAGNGFLERTRRIAVGTSLGPKDVIVEFGQSGGFVTSEKHHGGVNDQVPTSNTCSASLGTADYELSHEYQYGALKKSFFVGDGARLVDRDIDASTGLVEEDYSARQDNDTQGFSVRYEYDDLGRMTEANPYNGSPLGACTDIDYQSATWSYGSTLSVSGLAHINRYQRPGGGSCLGAIATAETIYFDGNGAVSAERRNVASVGSPGNTVTSERLIERNVLGWTTCSTELESTSEHANGCTQSSSSTTFSGFDRYGRPKVSIAPDGFQTDYAHVGEQWSASLVRMRPRSGEAGSFCFKAGQSNSGWLCGMKILQYDGYGRLVSTRESLRDVNAGDYLFASYGHDAGGRLKSAVLQHATYTTHNDNGFSLDGPAQSRGWTYDGRGFLTSETHPETGQVLYAKYDSRGNVLEKRYSSEPSTKSRRYYYDAAGRLDRVEHQNGTKYKQFEYYGNSSAANGLGARGQLKTAKRWSYLPGGNAYLISETYTYKGRDGRPDGRHTEIAPPGEPSIFFYQRQEYDELGGVSKLVYPCRVASVASTDCAVTTREVDFTYDEGALSTVTSADQDYVTNLLFHRNGMPHQYQLANSKNYTLGFDPNRMGRPSSFSDGATTWTLAYDGAGNVTQVGGAQYYYRGASRLIEADLGSSTNQQRYTYDDFGNRTNVENWTGSSWAPNLVTVSTGSNRVTGPGTWTYDEQGNMTSRPDAGSGSVGYTWDLLGAMLELSTGAQDHSYVYTADDERIVEARPGDDQYTLRDFNGQVIREYRGSCGFPTGGNAGALFADSFETDDTECWSKSEPPGSTGSGYTRRYRDSIYAGPLNIASVEEDGETLFYYRDHLRSPRTVRDSSGSVVETYEFFPFGEQVTPSSPSGDGVKATTKFTSHERDEAITTNVMDDLDYMHARYSSPLLGRFVSVDPISGKPGRTLSWNRYIYSYNNPMSFVDPDGLEPLEANVLQFFNRWFGADFSSTQLFLDSRLVPNKNTAIALGNFVFVEPGETSSGVRRRTLEGLALLGHELDHVRFYQIVGGAFYGAYVGNYLENRFKGEGAGHNEAYLGIVFEELARKTEARVRTFLQQHPDILEKLISGEPLSEADLEAINADVEEHARSGGLKKGLQFIQGFLVYVR